MEPMLKPLTLEEINAESPVEIEIQPDPSEEKVEVEISTGEAEFKQNLAEVINPSLLQSIGSEILNDIRIDKTSRREWEKTVTNGMELLGMRIEERTEPWKGACGVFHSIMSEAVIKFQSELIMETFPADGPVHTKIIGKVTKDKLDAADRVKEDMDWQLTENMCEYRGEHERMLWNLAFYGSAFKKVYFDPSLNRQVSMFVPAEDIYLPYGSSDLSGCPRITHVMRKSENEIKKLIDCGFYAEQLIVKDQPQVNDIEKKKQKLAGQDSLEDDRITLYEVHLDLDLFKNSKVGGVSPLEFEEDDGIERPYVVTLDANGTVFSVYRNWEPDDETKKSRQHFVHYIFIPGFGSYGFGYVHILGGYAKGATSVLRQLVDAGTLANLPGGLKARGLRIKGDDTPIAPGEFRDVDVPAGSIRDNIINLPYKEPSATLLALFKEIVDEGRSLASTADMKVADMNQQAPVGTTLAIIERMMKVMSAVQARVHAAMKKEFKLLKAIIRDYTPEEYEYETTGEGRMVKQADYELCEVIPVSDPNASSSVQRMAQYQAALQLSQTAPQLYDMPQLHRNTLKALGMKNSEQIIPDKDNMMPRDPISENMNILNGKPVKAFLYQDHDAHILVHMSAAQDPKVQQLVGQNPQVMMIQQALQSHLMEHMAFKYRADIEKQMGVQLPMNDEDMPEDVELMVARLAAEAAPMVLLMHSQKAAQEQAMQQQQDPAVQAEQMDQQTKAKLAEAKIAETQFNIKKGAAELALKQKVEESKDERERMRLDVEQKIAGLNAGKDLSIAHQQREHDKKVTGFKEGMALRKAQRDQQGSGRPVQKGNT